MMMSNPIRPTVERLLSVLALLAVTAVASPAVGWLEAPDGAIDEGALHEGDARVETRLITDVDQVAPGDTIRVAVAFSMDEHWHIYWQNPGDAGVPTKIDWQSDQLEFGPLKWSVPKMFQESGGELTVFGYEDRIILYSEATVAEDATGSVDLSATVDYLACSNACMPGHSRLERTIPVGEKTKQSDREVLSAMETYSARVPRPAEEFGLEVNAVYSQTPIRPEDSFTAALEVVACGEEAEKCAGWEPLWQEKSHAFIPDRYSRADVTVTEVREHPAAERGWIFELSGQVREGDERTKDLLTGVMRFRDSGGREVPVYLREEFPMGSPGASVETIESELLGSTGEPVASASGSAGGGSSGSGGVMDFLWAIAMAFVGGMILNLMPCVFPVLALKVTSFTQVVQESRRGKLAHGAAYTAGIVGSLLSLGLVVVGLRMAGTQVGWGFQFQQPAFPAVLSVVVTLFGLNLFDVFDVNVSAGGMSKGADEESGLKSSVGEGILAVVLATPCSAPFLGTAVGFAFASNAWTILAVFAALGLGLAAPFVVLTMVPGWTKVLPRPGNWMKYLKQFLGFTLFGTAVWLVWLVGRQAGVDAMAGVMGWLVVAGLSAWGFGLVQHSPSALKKWGVTGVAAAAIAAGGLYVFPIEAKTDTGGDEAQAAEGPIDWEPWSKETIEGHLQEGRPVFVDFTADWCLTCKVNERNAITAEPVVEAAESHDVAMLKADWTDGGERIRRELANHGKAGVPMYLVYSPEAPDEPTVLPELLSEQRLIEAFTEAAGESDE